MFPLPVLRLTRHYPAPDPDPILRDTTLFGILDTPSDPDTTLTAVAMATSQEKLPRSTHERRGLEQAPMTQSRETGDVVPNAVPEGASPFAKSWVHFVAGG